MDQNVYSMLFIKRRKNGSKWRLYTEQKIQHCDNEIV